MMLMIAIHPVVPEAPFQIVPLWEMTFDGPVQWALPIQADNDPKLEIAIYIRGNPDKIIMLDGNGTIISDFDTSSNFAIPLDIDNNGIQELLSLEGNVFHAINVWGQDLWFHELRYNRSSFQRLVDWDQDSQLEIVLLEYPRDNVTYVEILDLWGNLETSIELNRHCDFSAFGEFGSKAETSIICPYNGGLAVYNFKGEMDYSFMDSAFQEAGYFPLLMEDETFVPYVRKLATFTSEGIEWVAKMNAIDYAVVPGEFNSSSAGIELLTMGLGHFIIWNQNGNPLLNQSIDCRCLVTPTIVDLDGDYYNEVVFSQANNLLVLDNNLKTILVYSFDSQISMEVSDINLDGRLDFMVFFNRTLSFLTTTKRGGQIYWKGWGGSYKNTRNVLDVDKDLDGLADYYERQIGTDPSRKDTDYDGYNDLEELQDGYDPKDPTSFPNSGFVMGGLAAATIFTAYIIIRKLQRKRQIHRNLYPIE